MPHETEEVHAYAVAGNMPEAVCAYVKYFDHVSFVELGKILEPYLPTKGNHCLCLPDYENLVVWLGMSPEWTQLMIRLLADHRVYLYPSSSLVYLIDGGFPRMPIAKSVRHYKTEHWCPTVLRVIPPVLAQKKAKKVAA